MAGAAGLIAAAGFLLIYGTELLGHQQAFFAPVSAIITLGLTVSQRGRRAVEVAIGVAVGLAHLSYVAIERPMLRIKERYAVVASAMDSPQASGSGSDGGPDRPAEPRAIAAH